MSSHHLNLLSMRHQGSHRQEEVRFSEFSHRERICLYPCLLIIAAFLFYSDHSRCAGQWSYSAHISFRYRLVNVRTVDQTVTVANGDIISTCIVSDLKVRIQTTAGLLQSLEMEIRGCDDPGRTHTFVSLMFTTATNMNALGQASFSTDNMRMHTIMQDRLLFFLFISHHWRTYLEQLHHLLWKHVWRCQQNHQRQPSRNATIAYDILASGTCWSCPTRW